jgi:hypothetical protein
LQTSDYIAFTIDRLPNGYVFTYADFITEVSSKEAIIKALNRLVKSGKIAKLSKGRYFKPETTPFGVLQPNQAQVVKDLLEEDGRITGYVTGYSIYNQLGLTSQVSNVIQIGKNRVRPAFQRERYTISFVLQKNTIRKENIPLLQILDCIRYIKRIPDTTVGNSLQRFKSIISTLPERDISMLTRLAIKYPPMVRALLGALLDETKKESLSEPLYRSLNPITKYKLKGTGDVLRKKEKWNIV